MRFLSVSEISYALIFRRTTSLCSVSFRKMTTVTHFVRMVYFLGVTSIHYMFFPFFLWEAIFFLAEGFESQTKVWMPDSLVWTLKAVTDTASTLGFVLERPWQICGLLDPFTQWLLAFGMGLPKRQWINTHRSRSDPFLGLLLVSVGFHTAGRSCWDKFMSSLWQQLTNGAVACFVEENAKAHTSFKYTFAKYMHAVSNTCSDCAMVKQICPRKAKFRTVLCLGCL